MLASTQANYLVFANGPKPEEVSLAKTRIRRAEMWIEKIDTELQTKKTAYSLKLIPKLELETASHQKRLAEL